MRWLMVLCLVVLVLGCSSPNKARQRQVIPADIPPGTEFQQLADVDFQVEPVLRILRDPQNPADGIAAVKLVFTSKANETRKNVHAAVWLPEGVLTYTGMGLIGTNLDPGMWNVDLTPERPSMGVLTDFKFPNFAQHGQIVSAFSGPTRVKILWDGGVRFFQFPGDLWQVHLE